MKCSVFDVVMTFVMLEKNPPVKNTIRISEFVLISIHICDPRMQSTPKNAEAYLPFQAFCYILSNHQFLKPPSAPGDSFKVKPKQHETTNIWMSFLEQHSNYQVELPESHEVLYRRCIHTSKDRSLPDCRACMLTSHGPSLHVQSTAAEDSY